MTDQKNFVLAMLLSGLVLAGYWFFFGKPMAEQTQRQLALEQETIAATEVTPPTPVRPREELITTGGRIKIDSPALIGSFSVTGSRFDDIRLKNYKQTLDDDSETVIMLTPEGADWSAYVFDNWTGPNGGTGANTQWAVVSGNTLTPSTPVVMQHTGDNFTVERTVSVDEKFLITLDDTVTNTSGGEINVIRKGVSRQHGLPEGLTNFFILQEGPIAVVGDKLVDMKYKKLAKKQVMKEAGESGWVGLTDKYWLTASIAPQDKTMTADFYYRIINDQDVYEAAYELTPITLTAGASIKSTGYVYAGAKERPVLERYEKDLGISHMDLAIDWGAMGILVRPMSTALTFLGHKIGNFGLGILALTLIIKIVLFPLFNKQYASQAKMKLVQPKLKKIQAMYKDDRMKLQQEMMAMYRKEGVNPAAGCLPVIPTIFIFFALYKTVFINVDLRHAPFFGWIQDLSAKDPLSVLNLFGILPWDPVPVAFFSFLAIGPLAILYGITMALMYQLTPQPGMGGGDQAAMQAKIFKWMPWIFMFVLAPFATGLLVYWVWNNILSFMQQYYITRKFKVDTPVDAFIRKLRGQEDPAASE